MIAKTLIGVEFFDAQYGGVYRGRSLLVSGRAGTGKTVLGLQFICHGLRQDERCLILSTMAANDLAICAETMGFPLASDLDLGNLILLEYRSFVAERYFPTQSIAPPEGFDQLQEIIDANSIRRVLLDTVLPWVASPYQDQKQMMEQIFSFVRAFDRMGVTTLMTIPKPVSPMAFRLKTALEEVVPVALLLAPTDQDGIFTWQAVKYLGEKKLAPPCEYVIETGRGLIAAGTPPKIAPTAANTTQPAILGPAGVTAAGTAAGPVAGAPPKHVAQGPGGVRFASVWAPATPEPRPPQ